MREVPHKPGVYLHRDRLGSIIYVGKARDLRKRLASYFTPSRQRMAEHKTRALIQSIWDFDYHEVRNETEALLLEGKLIKEYRPKYNIAFRDDKRFLLVKVHLEEPWPRFQLTRLKKEDGARYFGPFAHSSALRSTISWLNREFGLRNCRPMNPGEKDYQHCHDDVIKNCTAPCIGRISREDYLARVEKACDFLLGHSKDLIGSIEEEMQEAATALDFERAAELRDMIGNLRQTLLPTRQFKRRGVPGKAINPEADVVDLQEFLQLDRPPLVMECFDISNISSNHIVASMVRFRNGVPDNSNYRRYRIKTVTGQDDFASMAEVIRRRYSRILLEARDLVGEEEADVSQENPLDVMRRLEDWVAAAAEEESEGKKRKPFVRLPDLVIVDGGKGQLSMAVKELHRLGLHDLPVIGLAKQREEVFRPGQSDPLVIPHDQGALKLLQRIRDEAHRIANGYHQLLMKRRVEESILDDCPGISRGRKERLLEKFGSVSRLRKTNAEAMTSVSGIHKKLADEIVLFLKTH
ncbi:MAG: excinuclease ABC subunit UvrC [Verrucomicrobiales bacterium]|jgi:excinuclease ABC subunit C|nr:excinuclease ABC subunit UvrC [Verrucomicrobiales bacterium]